MTEILADRLCAEMPDGVVVFAIGMRINRWLKPQRWLPVVRAMGPMLAELARDREAGLLSSRLMLGGRTIGVLQHWRDVEALQAYAHRAGGRHLAAWRRFNAQVGTSGDVGIWHETYVVPGRGIESIYVNMPRYGLGLAGALFPARGERASAARRLGRRDAGEDG